MWSTDDLPGMLDELNTEVFYKQNIAQSKKEETLQVFLSRQIVHGKHAGLFDLTRNELERGVHLYTGERMHTHLGARNVFSAEIGRFSLLLGLTTPATRQALERLNKGLQASCFVAEHCTMGECAHSGIAFMRYLSVGGFPEAEPRLLSHLQLLAVARDGKGGWFGFPRYYTLLTLSEINLPAAVDEIRYATANTRNQIRKMGNVEEKYHQRRQLLWERLLAGC